MKVFITLFFFSLPGYSVYCQSDSIGRYIPVQPTFQFLDSVSRNLEEQGKVVNLVFYESGIGLHSGIILWNSEGKHFGTYFKKEYGKPIQKTNIDRKKINRVLSSRIFSDSCDLCELARGENKADIDHEYIIYLKRRTGSKCNEMYFTSSHYLYYESDNCIYDIREIIAL